MKTPGTLVNIVKYHAYVSFECLECFQQNIVECGWRSFPLDLENLSAEDELECYHCKTMHYASGISKDKLIIET